MAINEIKCKNCGAILNVEDDLLVCPNCGTKYVMKDDVNNNYVTNNETIIKNYYGSSATKEKNKEKVNNYLTLAISNFNAKQYADAKDRLNRVLNIDPSNVDAQILYELLTKGTNGRYISPPSYKCFMAIKDWLQSGSSNTSQLEDFIYYILMSSVLSLNELKELEEEFYNSDFKNKDKFINLIQKTKRRIIVFRWISLSIVAIICIMIISCAFSNNGKQKEKNITYSVIYYTSEGGYIYVPNKGTNYTVSYGFDVKKGNSGHTVIANPKDGYKFSKWSDGYSNARRTDNNVQGNIRVTAYFVRDNNYVSITYIAGEGGTIMGENQQMLKINGTGTFVVAIPYIGYNFVKWSDGLETARRQEINVQSSQTFTAIFELQ